MDKKSSDINLSETSTDDLNLSETSTYDLNLSQTSPGDLNLSETSTDDLNLSFAKIKNIPEAKRKNISDTLTVGSRIVEKNKHVKIGHVNIGEENVNIGGNEKIDSARSFNIATAINDPVIVGGSSVVGGNVNIGGEFKIGYPNIATAINYPFKEYLNQLSTFMLPIGNLIQKKIISIKDFKEKLQAYYQNLTLPKPPWLDKGIDLSIDDFYVDLQLTKSKKPIEIQNIFSKIEDKKPTRILIEGQPGYGKTTLALKLAYDWARNEDYIKHFKLLFFIPLRELGHRSIEEYIVQLFQKSGIDRNSDSDPNFDIGLYNSVIKLINDFKKDILFLFDGLDELKKENRGKIIEILCGEQYSDGTVMAFSRTSLLTVNESQQVQFFDKQISTMGVQNLSNKRQFLRKFFSQQSVEDIIQQLPPLTLFDSPLILLLLAIIVTEESTTVPFTTRTELYKKLFNSIIKHSMEIHNFDLFSIKSDLNYTQKIIEELGELSLHKILENELQFTINLVTKQIYDAGFFIKHKSMFTSTNHYELFHLSFMEFAAAYALWIDIKFNNLNNLKTFLKLLVMHFVNTNGTSLVLVFLASLMQDDIDKFIIKIHPYSYFFSSNFTLTVKLFQECTSMCDWNVKSIISDFLPQVVDLDKSFIDYIPAVIYKNLFKIGSMGGKIKSITIQSYTQLECIPDDILINSKVVYRNNIFQKIISNIRFNNKSEYKNIFENLVKMSNDCTEFEDYLSIFVISNIESSNLILDKDDNVKYLEVILKTKFSKIKWHLVKVLIHNECEMQMIAKVITRNQVEYLDLSVNLNLTAHDLCIAAAQSTSLTHIELREVSVDLYDLTQGGTKKYNCIKLFNCTLSCTESLMVKNCCDYLLIEKEDNLEEIDGIIEMEPTSLHCSSTVFDYLINKYPKWSYFQIIKDLSLDFHEKSSSLNVLVHTFYHNKTIVLWDNLQILCIDNVEVFDVEMFIKWIRKLPIVKFAIGLHEQNHTTLLSLFKCMNDCMEKDPIGNLKTIDLINWHLQSHDVTYELLKGVICNHWEKVNLVYPLFSYDDLIEISDVVLNFNVTQYFYGSCEDDVAKFRIEYSKQMSSNYVAFCITKIPNVEWPCTIGFPLKFTDILKIEFLTKLFPQPLELFNFLKLFQNTESFENRTELYKVLINSVIGRNYRKKKNDLFDFRNSANQIQELIQEFGNLSLKNKNLTDNNVQFDCTSLTEKLYKTGLFIEHKTKKHYEVIHFSIMEFACAFDGWIKFELYDSNWEKDFLDPIVKLFLKTRGTSLVLPFLAGLMKFDFNKLLKKIKQFSLWFLLDFHFIIKLFQCCAALNDDKLDTFFLSNNLKYFTPAELDVRYIMNDSSLNTSKSLVKDGIDCGNIKLIKIDNKTSPLLFSNITLMPSLKIFLNFNQIQLTALTRKKYYKKNVFVEEVFKYLQLDYSKQEKNVKLTLEKYLTFIAHPNIESCALALDNLEAVKELEIIIKDGKFTLSNLKLYYLRIKIQSENEKQIVTKLLENKHIQFLELKGKSQLDMSGFHNTVAQLLNLTSIDMFNVTIDLYDLTNGGRKIYNYINLNNCKVTCKEPLINSKCCHFLSFNKFYEAMCELEPICLDSESDIIYELMECRSEWVGFNSVKHLTLDAICENEIFVKSLTPWEKLDTLYIRLWDEFDADMIINIMQCIKKHKIKKFVFKYDLQPVTNLIQSFNDMFLIENANRLETIDIIKFHLNSDEDEFKSEMVELLKGLKLINWRKVNLVFGSISDEILTLIDLSQFDVTHYTYGSNDDNPVQYRIAYKNSFGSELHAFCITIKQ